MSKQVLLTFRAKRYGREGMKEVVVHRSNWDTDVTDWLWPAMEQYEKDTALSPAHLTEWDVLKQALPGLAQVPRWKAFTQIPIPRLEMEDVRDLFMDIDDAFHRAWGSDQGALRSARVRRFLSNHLLRLRPDGLLSRVHGSFRPKGRSDHEPRALISDQVGVGSSVTERAPLGAMPHANPAELKALQAERLQADLEKIEDACQRELSAYFHACAVLDAIGEERADLKLQAKLLTKLSSRKTSVTEYVSGLTERERRALVAYYYRLDSQPGAKFEKPDYEGGSVLARDMSAWMGIDPLNFQRCLRYRYYPNQVVLVAAMVLIQLKTAWNIGAVVELKADAVHYRPQDGFLIQSVKTKTGDDTPSVLLEGADNPGFIALRFAVDRLIALKRRGWVDPNEQCLWLGPRSNYDSGRGLPIANISAGLKRLREKHALVQFTFEQLRTQKLTVVSVKEGPIAAAEMAGHSTFTTIGGYIDHLVTQRINSSVNLEFQRRWEAEVAARIELQAVPLPLMPIGDGASCVDPSKPPDDAWLRAGVCDAGHCHQGNGCPNRRLIIDSDRVEEVLLTRKYYLTNWHRLHAENAQAFSLIHMPRMEFNIYLFEYLKKGPYRHMLNG